MRERCYMKPNHIKDLLTLPVSIMAAIAIGTGLLIFLPDSLLKTMYLIDLQNSYGQYIGIAFILSLSILVVNIVVGLLKTIKQSRNMREFYDKAEERLLSLNDYQKSIVFLLYNEDNHTLNLPHNDGAVSFLSHRSIIGMVSEGQFIVNDLNNPEIPYMLQPWVIDEISKSQVLKDELRNAFQRQKVNAQHKQF